MVSPVDLFASVAVPRWLDEAPESLSEASTAAARTAERLDVVRAGVRTVLGDSAAAVGWSGPAAAAAGAAARERCDQLGELCDLVGSLGAELAVTADRLADRRDQLRRLSARLAWEAIDPLAALWILREIDRVVDDARAVDAAAAANLGVLADGLHGMAHVRHAGEWIDPVAPDGSLVWLREHDILPSPVERDLVRFAAGLAPGPKGTALLRERLLTLPAADLSALLAGHPAIAARLAGDHAVPAALAGALSDVRGPDRIAAVRAAWQALPQDERRSLALLYPNVIGPLDGITLADRISANHVLIAAALDAERVRRAAVMARIDGRDVHHGPIDYLSDTVSEIWDRLDDAGPIRSFVDDFEGDPLAQLERSDRRIALYESLLRDGRQVLAFDPRGDGVIVELFGDLGRGTESVAVLVPGTFVAMESYDGWASIARDFHGQDPRLATIAWMGGDFPDTLSAAAQQSYAAASGPALRDFMAGLDLPAGSNVTVLGYSYGGAVVGVAEREGMVADRVLHVATAGAGSGVRSLDDYAGGVREHYTMTAPGDPIALVRGINLGSLGHGEDPEDMPGFVRLPAGCYGADDPRAGRRIEGIAGHTDVFSPGSTAWKVMRAIMLGEPIGRDIARCER